MKQFSILIFITFSIVTSFAQSKIIGNVVYLNSGKKSAVGIEITAEGSSGDISKDNGEYVLNFPNKKPGTTISPIISNSFMQNDVLKKIEVVNTEQIKYVNIPINPDKNPLKIIVCPKGFRDDAAKKYYKILKSSSDLELKKIKRKLEYLFKEKQKDYKKITKLSQFVEKIEKQNKDSIAIYKKALKLASINKDDADKDLLKYLKLLEEGKSIREALKVLDIEKASNQLNSSINSFNDNIKLLETRAQGLISIFDIKNAISTYDTIIHYMEKAEINPLLLVEKYRRNAGLTGFIGNYNESVVYLNKAMSIINNYTLNSEKIELLHHLSIAYWNLNEFEKSILQHKEVIDLFHIMYKKNDVNYEILAKYIVEFSDFQSLTNNYIIDAIKGYNVALSIFDNLDNYQDKYLIKKSNIYIKLGKLHFKINQNLLALDNLNKAKNINETLNNYSELSSISKIEADFYKNSSNYPLALNSYTLAIDLISLAVLDHDNNYKKAILLSSIADVYSQTHKYILSYENYEKAISIYSKLIRKNPSRYIDFGRIYFEMELIMGYESELTSMKIEKYKKMVEINNSIIPFLKKNDIDFYSHSIELKINTLLNLAKAYEDNNDLIKAIKLYKEIIISYSENNNLTSKAKTLTSLSVAYFKLNNYIPAYNESVSALEIFLSIAKTEVNNDILISILNNLKLLSKIENKNKRYSTAFEIKDTELHIYSYLANKTPDEYNIYLVFTYIDLATILLKTKKENKKEIGKVIINNSKDIIKNLIVSKKLRSNLLNKTIELENKILAIKKNDEVEKKEKGFKYKNLILNLLK